MLARRDSGVRFVAVDLPEANNVTVGTVALVVLAECKAILRCKTEAPAMAKARGVKLGYPNGAASLRRAGKGGAALCTVVSANAAAFAAGQTSRRWLRKSGRLGLCHGERSPPNSPPAAKGPGAAARGTSGTSGTCWGGFGTQ